MEYGRRFAAPTSLFWIHLWLVLLHLDLAVF